MPDRRFGIVVGVDGSPSSAVTVSWAARDAELRNATLTLVHAVPSVTRSLVAEPASVLSRLARILGESPQQRARRVLGAALSVVDDSCRSGGPARVVTRVTLRDPAAALVGLSGDAELVVVGAGRARSARSAPSAHRAHRAGAVVRHALYGSVSSAVVRRSHCAVAVIHDEDPLMPHPAEAPVLIGSASQHAVEVARAEAARRGVALIEARVPGESAEALVAESESAQLVVVDDEAAGAVIAGSARMPVIIVR